MIPHCASSSNSSDTNNRLEKSLCWNIRRQISHWRVVSSRVEIFEETKNVPFLEEGEIRLKNEKTH